jgi:signal peptidase II
MRSIAVIIGFSVFALDLITKWWVKGTPWLDYYPVIEGFLTIQFVKNEGIAFGLLHSLQSDWKPIILSLIAVIAVSIVLYYIYLTPSDQRLSLFALGLLLGGILGNFVDRLMHQYVTDFITLHWKDYFAWPTFNVADSAITTGVFVILIQTLFVKKPEKALSAFLVIAFCLNVNAADPDQLIDQLQRKYDQIQSFTANFQQTLESRGITQTESGIVMMKKPGLMYWEYRNPREKYFVADGKKIYFYVPKEKQVLVSNMDLGESNSPLLFLLGKGDIRRDFLVEIDEEESEVDEDDPILLRLTPRQPHPDFSEVLLLISPTTFLINKLTVVEPIGQQNEYELTSFKPNEPIPDHQFKLEVPSHVEVIED